MDLRFLVARERPDLYEVLRREFAREEAAGEVLILFDRHRRERRRQAGPHAPERRHTERRSPSGVDAQLHGLGWAIL